MSTRMKQVAAAIITVAIYTALLGWKVALLLAVGVGFHEYGHLWAARRMGLETRGFYLLPFMGGVALVAGRYRTYSQQAFVVIMGPLWGAFLALVSFGVYLLTHQVFWLQASAWMALLNLFNLLPLSFMDGGQLMGTITYSINKTLGMVFHTVSTVIAVFVLFHYNPLLSGIVGFFGGASVAREIRDWYQFRKGNLWLVSDNYMERPKSLSIWQMVLVSTSWAALSAALFGLMTIIKHIPSSSFMLLFK